jgi:hypothetical protein
VHWLGKPDVTRASPSILVRALRYELAEIDLDQAAAGTDAWFYRPFDEIEVGAHPDGERIGATARAAALRTLALALARLEDGYDCLRAN